MIREITDFKLDDNFINKYSIIKPDWGGVLGEITFFRTYSRLKDDGSKEHWFETVRRVVEGTFSMQKSHIISNHKKWDEFRAQRSAKLMYDLMFNFKFTPPGRGLWVMGSSIIKDRNIYAALNNCAFVSTNNLDKDPIKPFTFLMDMSMLGVGVGFDITGAGKAKIYKPNNEIVNYVIPDSREGWVESVDIALSQFLLPDKPKVTFDYSEIRVKGAPIKGFGGISSGPAPLVLLHQRINEIFEGTSEKSLKETVNFMNSLEDKNSKEWWDSKFKLTFHSRLEVDLSNVAYFTKSELPEFITRTQIVDIQNCIGACVVSGNVRRSAEIALGDNNQEFFDLKDYDKNPQRANIGWTSNNSVVCRVGDDYTKIAKSIEQRGEPGVIWLDNIQEYSRMSEAKDYKDYRAVGTNPCCFSGNTLVFRLDGKKIPLSKIGIGEEFWVLGNKDNKIIPTKAKGLGVTRKERNYVIVELDNSEKIECTLDHPFMLRDGSYKQAQYLTPEDSLMPLYYRLDDGGYYEVFNNDKWVKLHTLVNTYSNSNERIKVSKSTKDNILVSHHVDFNKLNNSPENLQWMGINDHIRYHSENQLGDRNSVHRIKDRDGWKRRLSISMSSEGNHRFGKEWDKSTKDQISKTMKLNWENPELRAKWMEIYSTEEFSKRMSEIASGERLDRVILKCKQCDKDITVTSTYKDRERFCSQSCINIWRHKNNIEYQKTISITLSNTVNKLWKDPKFREEATLRNIENGKNSSRNSVLKISKKVLDSGKELNEDNYNSLRKLNSPYFGTALKKFESFEVMKECAKNYNHKIVSLTFIKSDSDLDFYDINVPETSNFALNAGVFVHNSEQSLESMELCCLVEVFLNRIKTLYEFKQVLKYSYMYAKTVTLGHTHWEETNDVLMRNRRIGNSLTGVVQFLEKHGLPKYVNWLKEGYETLKYYDKVYSEWFAVPQSIKMTSIKPSGTVSLLAGSTPGVHWPKSVYYMRTMRIGINDPIIPALQKANFKMEPDVTDPTNTFVVYFPVMSDCKRSESEVSIWEKFNLVDITQKYWADNQVSVTLTYDPKTEPQYIKPILDYGQFSLKSVSFLPIQNNTYPQMPYTSCSREEYEDYKSTLGELDLSGLLNASDAIGERYCTTDSCEVPSK